MIVCRYRAQNRCVFTVSDVIHLTKRERNTRWPFTSLWLAFGRSHPETERRRQINGKKEFFGCFRRQVALSRANNSEDEIIKMGPRKTCQPWRTDRSRKRSPARERSRARSHARISRTKLFYECWSPRVTRIMQSAPAESDNFYVFRVARRLVGPSVRSRQNVEFPLGDKEPFATSGVFPLSTQDRASSFRAILSKISPVSVEPIIYS